MKPHERVVRATFQGGVPGREFYAGHSQIVDVKTVNPQVMEITLARDDAAWLNRCLIESGFQVAAIAPRQKTLKEFFLSITGGGITETKSATDEHG